MSSVDNVHANPDIIEDTKELVLSQFSDSDNVQKFVELIAERVSSYEDLAESIHTGFLLANATGQTLDFIGEFINLPRDERTDEQYRNAIIFSAIGASAEVNRDGIETLVQLVTGQLGGYFIQGNYRDVYMYLQESCLDRDTAREFLDRYMPLGTELSLLFESGISFGFEGNDAAAGFGKVTERAAEGTAGFKVPLSEAQSNPSYVLPRAAEFSDDQDRDFRTEFAVDIPTAIRAFQWQIPDTYNQGDKITINIAEQGVSNPTAVSEVITVEQSSGIRQEIAEKVAKVFADNGLVRYDGITVDNSGGEITVSVGYAPVTDTSRFISRNSQAVEVDSQGNMTLKSVDEPRYSYRINEQGSEEIAGLFYELPSQNEVLASGDFSSSNWPRSDTANTEQSTEFFLSSESFIELSNDSNFEITKDITPATPNSLYTFSVYMDISGGQSEGYIRIDNDYLRVDFSDNSVVSSDFSEYNVESVTDDVARVSATISVGSSPSSVTLGVGFDYTASSGDVTMKVGGAQFEPFSRATSYMPTDGNIFVRAQDYVATPSGSLVNGFANGIDLQVNAKDTTGASVWSYSNLIALTKGEAQVDQGTPFTASQSLPVTIQEAQAVEDFYSGFGTAYQEPEDESTAEWGRLCTRESLTSRDFLSLPPVQPEDFEYSLDSRFSEVQGAVSAAFPARPLQRQGDNDLVFSSPSWDGTLSGQSPATSVGRAVTSPSGVTALNQFSEASGFLGGSEPVKVSVGDLDIPTKPFYYEIDIERYSGTPVDTIGFALIYTYYENVIDSEGNVEYLSYSGTISVIATSQSIGFSMQTEKLSGDVIGESVEGKENFRYASDVEVDSFNNPGEASVQTVGVLVDPRQGIARVYTDGNPYDGDTGLVTITDVLLETNIPSEEQETQGDALPVMDAYVDQMFIACEGYTDNSLAEPSSPDDYGIAELVYEPTQLSYVDQLPAATVDIFGRNIASLRDTNIVS